MVSRWRYTALLVAAVSWIAGAMEYQIDLKNSQQCGGMYSKSAWGGNIDPFIHFSMISQPGSTNTVPLIIYEYKDVGLIGHEDVDQFGLPTMKYVCDDDAIAKSFCNATQRYEFILAANATNKSVNPIYTEAIALNDSKPIKYPISRTGYYCVLTWDMEQGDYTAVAEFRNAFGELPAAQIAKLPFYGGLTLVYAVLGIFWAFLYVQNRHDILPVQNYITAILVFLVVEMLLTWGYYDYQNVHGVNMGTRVYLVIVSILNAARNSFSFFLLLIVCLGYGVVKPSLGKTMIYVRYLAAAHFAFGVIYSTASLTIHPEDAGPAILLIIMPLSATLTAFYIWTLNGLGMTMKDLMERKQHVKAGMYRKLWWCILTTILVIFAFFFFNSFTFVGVSEDGFAPSHWQTRWFILDGWLNVVYLADVSFVAYLWRPTVNNRRFAMSDELAQDDEGFDLAIRDSLDSLDDLENGNAKAQHTPPSTDSNPDNSYGSGGITSHAAASSTTTAPPSYSRAASAANYGGPGRTESPLPAPTPRKPASLPRESLDGETIFAVGEDDDKWSDDEEEESLVKKKD